MENLNQKNISELETIAREKRTELRKFRFDMSGSKIKNVKLGRSLRREIARVLTLIGLKNREK